MGIAGVDFSSSTWYPITVKNIVKILVVLALWLSAFSALNQPIFAQGSVLGVHILHPGELEQAKQLIVTTDPASWHYVTIPLTLADVGQTEKWQTFFDEAKQDQIIPIVRLTTRFENEAWQVPSREEVIRLLEFLNQLQWPTAERYVIVFNEVNHAKEWGGKLDPAGYAAVLRFTSQYARALSTEFQILPAAMDLAAPNGKTTMEAFTYLRAMRSADPDVLNLVDYWNSHSYPNPAFSSSPERTTQNSLRGFTHELSFLKQETNRDFQVFITETGWVESNATRRWLESYYTYALQHVWSDPRIIAVTPFLLRGDPGPFAGFSFFDKDNQPTDQFTALRKALEKNAQLSAP